MQKTIPLVHSLYTNSKKITPLCYTINQNFLPSNEALEFTGTPKLKLFGTVGISLFKELQTSNIEPQTLYLHLQLHNTPRIYVRFNIKRSVDSRCPASHITYSPAQYAGFQVKAFTVIFYYRF